MNYIINPSWFYWLDVVDGIKTAVFVLAIIAFFTGVIFLVSYVSALSDFYDCYGREGTFKPSNWNLLCKKIGIASVIVIVICIMGLVFIPSKDALIEMQIAKMATYENAQWTVDSLKSVVDYIIEAIQKVK